MDHFEGVPHGFRAVKKACDMNLLAIFNRQVQIAAELLKASVVIVSTEGRFRYTLSSDEKSIVILALRICSEVARPLEIVVLIESIEEALVAF